MCKVCDGKVPLDTTELIVHCYDIDFNRLDPLTTTITSAGSGISFTFGSNESGYVVCKKTSADTIFETVASQTFNIVHSLNTSDSLLVQVYDM